MFAIRRAISQSSRVARTFASRAAVVDNPYTGEVYCEVPYLTEAECDDTVVKSAQAQKAWANTSIEDRIALCQRAMDAMVENKDQIARDITGMMGRPLRSAGGELNGMLERATGMMDLAPTALADDVLPEKEGFYRALVREPVGVVAVVAPWNYPLLTTVNCVVPAVLAGNSVLIKHSSRTPLIAQHFEDAFTKAGAPEGLVMACNADHQGVAHVLSRPEVGYAHFTGSVGGGHQIAAEIGKRFIDVGLELGGKDPAYIMNDADLDNAVESVVDGAFFNSGQSCCGVERVYVHESLYDDFLDKALSIVQGYKLGDPMSAECDLGPMAQASSIPFLTGQVEEAKELGARVLCGGSAMTDENNLGRFFAPTLVADCNHSMNIMMEESFGPIMAVQKVTSDAEAIELMNDSPYGLTASLWTQDVDRATQIAKQVQTGTVFLNRCDYLDPYLSWTGVKDTGKGISLSKHGYHALTQVKSIHFRLPTSN